MVSSKVNQCVEALCKSGCEAVRATICNMEMGVELKQTSELDKNETTIVLNELKAIMAVYDDRK